MNNFYGHSQHGWSHVETLLAIIIFGGLIWLVASPERTGSGVKIGMGKEEAISAVGKPAKWEGKALAFCQDNSWDRCSDAKKSGAIVFLMWQTFIDAELIIGICTDGRVCFVG